MSHNYQVTHITEYTYETEASLCHNMMFQIPSETDFQRVKKWNSSISPQPSYDVRRRDFFDNEYVYFSVDRLHKKLTVKTEFSVVLSEPSWINLIPNQTMPWENATEWLHSSQAKNDVKQFYLASDLVPIVPGVYEYALVSFTPNRPILEALLDLNARIFHDFKFTPGFTDISTPLEKVFHSKKGVCQDFAHFFLSCLRSLGLSARYVSGYIETLPPPGKPKLIGADASHAWIAVFLPEFGWVELDATNNVLVRDKHIRVAYGRDFSDVTPLKGIVYSNGEQHMKVSVDVKRIP